MYYVHDVHSGFKTLHGPFGHPRWYIGRNFISKYVADHEKLFSWFYEKKYCPVEYRMSWSESNVKNICPEWYFYV